MTLEYNYYNRLIEVIIHDSSNFIFNNAGIKIGINKNRILLQIYNWIKNTNENINILEISGWIKEIFSEIEASLNSPTSNIKKNIKKEYWDIEAQIYKEE